MADKCGLASVGLQYRNGFVKENKEITIDRFLCIIGHGLLLIAKLRIDDRAPIVRYAMISLNFPDLRHSVFNLHIVFSRVIKHNLEWRSSLLVEISPGAI